MLIFCVLIGNELLMVIINLLVVKNLFWYLLDKVCCWLEKFKLIFFVCNNL